MAAAFAALPKSATDELVGELNQMLETGANDIRLQRIRRDAERLTEKPHTAIDAHSILGMVAAMKGDRDGIDRHFGIAFRASQDPLVRYNHALALCNIMHAEDGLRMILEVVERISPSPALYRQIVIVLTDFGDYECAIELSNKLKSLVGELDDDLIDKLETAKSRNDLFISAGVTSLDYAKRLEFLAELLRREGMFVIREIAETISHEGTLTEFIVRGTVERAAHLDSLIQNAIADLPFSPLDAVASFGCIAEGPEACQ